MSYSDPDSPSSENGSSTPNSQASTAATSISDSTGSDLSKAALVKHHHHYKKKKKSLRPVNHASGISTTVPLSGKRYRPTTHSTLADEVLMAIFEILHDDDPEAKGMTVKHICDILVQRHPEMANLSSKTSNLVSAKLNAYVKRIEKGDKSMKYALSRVWADTSPRRMVYVYRGILADNYPQFVQDAIGKLRETERANRDSAAGDSSSEAEFESESSPVPIRRKGGAHRSSVDHHHHRSSALADEYATSGSTSPFRGTSFDVPQFSVPYSSAPVTASLNTPVRSKHSSHSHSASHVWAGLMKESDSEDDDDDNDSAIADSKVPSSIGKRSKSMSFIQAKRPRTSHLTAAAATPRLPRKQTIADSPTAAAAVAALRASALNMFTSAVSESVSSITGSIMNDTSVEPSISLKWLETVRSGFLNQDIESPEEVSLAELDVMFA